MDRDGDGNRRGDPRAYGPFPSDFDTTASTYPPTLDDLPYCADCGEQSWTLSAEWVGNTRAIRLYQCTECVALATYLADASVDYATFNGAFDR